MKNIIIDTDLGFDCDDAGALAIANYLHKKGMINILAVTHCVNKEIGAQAIQGINKFYGNGDIPIGYADSFCLNVDRVYEEFFLKLKYRQDFKGFKQKPSFYKFLNLIAENKKGNNVNAETVIIDKLFSSRDKSITFVGIGQLNNLATIIEKHSEISRQKIEKYVLMCGNFSQQGEYFDDGETLWNGEFNIIMDLKSSQQVFADKNLYIDVIDYFQGNDILTGEGLVGQFDNPVYKAYLAHGKGRECPSWDLIAVMYASGLYDDCFEVSEYGSINVGKYGKTTFKKGKGNHRLIKIKSEKKDAIRQEINYIFAKGNKNG